MSFTSPASTILCSNCQKPSFEPRVGLDSLEKYTETLCGSDPFTLDLQEVKEMVTLCDRDLGDYEVELMRLQSQVLLIQEQQTRLEIHRARLHSFTSPTRKISNEILALIFDYACEVNFLQEEVPWTIEAGDRMTKLTSPIITYLPALSLSATCTRWRSVAKSFSSFWSRLRLEIVSEEAPTLPAFVSMVELFLMRSNQHPLEITLVIEGEPKNENPVVLDLLMQHSWRWKSFTYQGSYLPSDYLSYGSSRDFSNLDTLAIMDFECTAKDLDIFQNAPKLRKLPHFCGSVLTSQIPWAQVTDIVLWTFNEQLDKILDKCPNLTTLELWEDREMFIAPCNPPRTSKTIDTLNVIVNDCDTPQGILEIILSSLTLPALNKIFITSNVEQTKGRQWPKDLFATFLSRSSCRITTLVIRGVDLSDEDLISALRTLLLLTTLEISDHRALPPKDNISPITSHFISSLHIDHSMPGPQTYLIPKLRFLTLESDCSTFDDAAFISMISSRWYSHPQKFVGTVGGVDRLRSVVMRFHKRAVDQTVYRPLQDLDKMGLRVVVREMNGGAFQYEIGRGGWLELTGNT